MYLHAARSNLLRKHVVRSLVPLENQSKTYTLGLQLPKNVCICFVFLRTGPSLRHQRCPANGSTEDSLRSGAISPRSGVFLCDRKRGSSLGSFRLVGGTAVLNCWQVQNIVEIDANRPHLSNYAGFPKKTEVSQRQRVVNYNET